MRLGPKSVEKNKSHSRLAGFFGELLESVFAS